MTDSDFTKNTEAIKEYLPKLHHHIANISTHILCIPGCYCRSPGAILPIRERVAMSTDMLIVTNRGDDAIGI